MRFGLFGLNFGPCADPALAIRVAVAAEESGFESVWTGEHVAMPIRDNPVLLAKALTTLDLVSGGRLIAGFGGGYVEAEFRALGVSFKDRGAITDEYLEAIRVLWTEELPRFQGRHAAFDGIRFEPKPRQRPHPPIVIGGHAPPALRRAARFGDGWYGFGLTVETAAPMVQELRRLRATTGRPPLEISLTTFEPLTPALVAQATQAGVDRLIVMPRVRAEQLEATVRALGAQFARAG